MAEAVKIIHCQLRDNGGSGWIQEGTEHTNNPIEIRHPDVRFLNSTGYRRKEVTIDGKKTYMHEKIRYIKNCPIISVEEQKKLGIEPSRDRREDAIPFRKGKLTVAEEGATIGLVQYLEEVYYNADLEDRSPNVEECYHIIRFDTIAESTLDEDEIMVQAQAYILGLRKKNGNVFEYEESKIDALCQFFGIHAASYPTRLDALMGYAKVHPKKFVEDVTAFDQTTLTEVSHGLRLIVIKFQGNAAVYANKNKIIRNFGTGNFNHEKKIGMLADWFRTHEGYPAYMEFKAELEVAKNRELNNEQQN